MAVLFYVVDYCSSALKTIYNIWHSHIYILMSSKKDNGRGEIGGTCNDSDTDKNGHYRTLVEQ